MKRMYMLELSDVFGDQVYLPYSTGVVLSHAFSNSDIKENYELIDWFYYRESLDVILNKIEEPDVIGFSCFIWNWNLN